MSSDITDTTWFYEFLAWAETHKKQIIAGVAGVAVLALVISYAVWRKNQTAEAANEALLKLTSSTSLGEKEAPPSPQAYLRIAAEYPSTLAGGRALLLGAGALFSEGKYAEALEQFRKFQNEHRHPDLDPIAAMGVASSLDALNKVDEAIQAYQEVIRRYGNETVAAQARLALGRLYETKNQPELALKSYDELTKDEARSVWSSEAMELRERLLARFPNLAPKVQTTNAISNISTNLGIQTVKTSAPVILSPLTNAPAAPGTNPPQGKP